MVKLGQVLKNQSQFDEFQSLSRDSWWSNSTPGISRERRPTGFNPSVGILGGQTPNRHAAHGRRTAFQSLSRDSWWSNLKVLAGQLPQPSLVSIPQSGFLVVKRYRDHGSDQQWIRFNPSVGILGGQTRAMRVQVTLEVKFQSLSRDSWWSNQYGSQVYSDPTVGFNPSVGILGGQT